MFYYPLLPRWFSDKESSCQCRRCGFDPWTEQIPWRRKWQPTAVCLPGKSHEQRSLGRLQSMGSRRVRHDLATKQQHFEKTYLLPSYYKWEMLQHFGSYRGSYKDLITEQSPISHRGKYESQIGLKPGISPGWVDGEAFYSCGEAWVMS